MSLLEVKGLEVRYGGIRAVKGIDLEVEEGELVCLIGANGAGKTTTLQGDLRAHGAAPRRVRYAGARHRAACARTSCARRGLVMVPEGRGIFPQLTVEENLAMGAYARSDNGIEPTASACSTLFPRLQERRGADRRARSPAASSRCSPSRALDERGRSCCCSTSRAWASRR